MRCPWMLVAALLAACSDSTGVMIRVFAPAEGPQPTMVRLMIGGADVNDGQTISISPPGGDASADPLVERYRRGASAWIRDPLDRMSTQPISASEPARFLFKPVDGEQLGAVIAVGYDETTGLTGALSVAAVFKPQFVDGAIHVYDLHLLPAADPSAAVEHQRAPDQLQLWGPDQSCVYVKSSVSTGGHHEGFLILSEADRDCDGIDQGAPLECTPNTHLGDRPPNREELSCLATFEIATSTNDSFPACGLGGPRCTDGAPRDPASCDPSRYCVPSAVCAHCENAWACAFGGQDPYAGMGLTCEVPFMTVTVNGVTTSELCPGMSEAVALRPRVIPDELKCERDAIRSATQPFASALEEGDPTTPADWRLDVDVDASCGVTLVASGTDPGFGNGGVAKSVFGLLAIDLSRAGDTRANRDLAIPVRFTFVPAQACVDGPRCGLAYSVNDPDLTQCLLAAPMTP